MGSRQHPATACRWASGHWGWILGTMVMTSQKCDVYFRNKLAQLGVGIHYPGKSEHCCLLHSQKLMHCFHGSHRERPGPGKAPVFNPSNLLLVPIFNHTAKHLPGRTDVACNWISLWLLTAALWIPDKILTQMNELQHFPTESYLIVQVQVCVHYQL